MKKKIISILLAFVLAISPLVFFTEKKVSAEATINIGDYLQMGKYYGEPILWRCVDLDGNGPLMLSDRILTIKPFDGSGSHKYLDGTSQGETGSARTLYGSNLWETSSLRSWLNSSATAGNVIWIDGCLPTEANVYSGWNDYATEKGFLAAGNFTLSEQNVIKSVTQKSLLNEVDSTKLSEGGTAAHITSYYIASIFQNFDTAYFQSVTDRVFLLDVKQLNQVYLKSALLGANYFIGKITQKAIDNSEYTDNFMVAGDFYFNWSRSASASNFDQDHVRCINIDSKVQYSNAYGGYIGVRPAFYLNQLMTDFKSGDGLEGSPFILNTLPEATPTPSLTPTPSVTPTPTTAQTSTPTATTSPTAKPTLKPTPSPKPIIHVFSVKLNKKTLTIIKGKYSKLIATVSPVDTTNKKVTWKSSSIKIAMVSSTGVVKGIKKGVAYMTVMTVDGKKTAKCKVTVK